MATAMNMAVGETRTVVFDFTSDGTLGTDTLSSATVSILTNLLTKSDGSTAYTYADLSKSGSASVHGKQIWQNLVVASPAVLGVTYLVVCAATTSSGQVLDTSLAITIVAATT